MGGRGVSEDGAVDMVCVILLCCDKSYEGGQSGRCREVDGCCS